MKKLTENKLKSVVAYQGSFLTVLRDEVELPNGKTSVREYIPHPGASLIIPITDKGHLVMIRQYRYPLQAEFIEFPAGKLDAGEEPLTAAKRELAEEIGRSAKEFRHLTTIHPVIGYSNEKIEIYLARGLYEVKQHLEEDEFLNIFETSFGDAMDLMKQGKITDVKTMIALFWYEKVLREKW